MQDGITQGPDANASPYHIYALVDPPQNAYAKMQIYVRAADYLGQQLHGLVTG